MRVDVERELPAAVVVDAAVHDLSAAAVQVERDDGGVDLVEAWGVGRRGLTGEVEDLELSALRGIAPRHLVEPDRRTRVVRRLQRADVVVHVDRERQVAGLVDRAARELEVPEVGRLALEPDDELRLVVDARGVGAVPVDGVLPGRG